jgi:protein O-GlcNAc transferase
MRIAVFDTNWTYTLDTPYELPLGGTQSAIAYFLEEMRIRNHDCYLFNNREKYEVIRGVHHIPSRNSINTIKQNKLQFDIIIVSCLPSDLFDLKLNLNSPNTIYALWTGHDVDQVPSKMLKEERYCDAVDLFIFVSNWQRERYIQTYGINFQKTIILRNGIGKPFEKYLDKPIMKHKNSMTYCSIPWRGLDLLVPIFKQIKEKYEDARLEIFSGLNIYQQKDDNKYDEFKNMSGVTHNYGIGQEKLAEELFNIEYLTYPNTFQETSCITALQAMACGCIVITSNLGALRETMNNLNEYVDINIYNFDQNEYVKSFIIKLEKYMNMDDNLIKIFVERNREHIKKNYTWSIICSKFENDYELFNRNHKVFLENYRNYLISGIKGIEQQKWLETIQLFNQISFFPNLSEYYVIKSNYGVGLYNLGNLELAKKNFKIARQLKNDFNVTKNLALLENSRDDIIKFIKYGRQALEFEFNVLLANLLAEKYELIGNYHDAIGLYEAILQVDPYNINCLNNLGNLKLLMISQVDDFDKCVDETYEKSLSRCVSINDHRRRELVLSNIIFNNLYNWKLSDEEIFKRSCRWYEYFPRDDNLLNIVNKLDRTKLSNNSSESKKIRIGYISCDFLTHPVGYMFHSILKNHNTNDFEIFCYDCALLSRTQNDEISKKLRSYNNASWYNLENKSDEEVLTKMIDDNLDILVDMMGHTRNTRMNILSYKPARIIISYFAYPGTNGLESIDYKFTDKYATPPECQKYYKEKLYCLPNGFQCYTPPQELEAVKNYNHWAPDSKYKINLCCFNNPTKLSIPTIETFVEILKKLPEAKLILRYCYYKSSFYKESIIKLFVDRGIDRERLDVGYDQLVDSLKLYNNIDIALDPFPYNGGTISSEALYMNTPIITLEGSTYVSRVGVSLLSNLGFQKYIAKTRDEYVDKVVTLARNEKELKFLHQYIRIRMMKSDLANSVAFTTNIENAYRDIASKYESK